MCRRRGEWPASQNMSIRRKQGQSSKSCRDAAGSFLSGSFTLRSREELLIYFSEHQLTLMQALGEPPSLRRALPPQEQSLAKSSLFISNAAVWWKALILSDNCLLINSLHVCGICSLFQEEAMKSSLCWRISSFEFMGFQIKLWLTPAT